MSTSEKTKYLNEKQCLALSCKIATLLNGVSIKFNLFKINKEPGL